MTEILYNPYYLAPLASLLGCFIGLGFSYYYFIPRLNFLRKRLREKADELYRTKNLLDKSRYELVQIACQSLDSSEVSTKIKVDLEEQLKENIRLQAELVKLEKLLFQKQGIFGLKSKFDDNFISAKSFSDSENAETRRKSA
jgi:hypothetical protein